MMNMHKIEIYVLFVKKDIPFSCSVYKGDKSKRWKRRSLFLRGIYRSGFEDARQCFLGDEYTTKHLTDHINLGFIKSAA